MPPLIEQHQPEPVDRDLTRLIGVQPRWPWGECVAVVLLLVFLALVVSDALGWWTR
jgi:hypothetical protein